MEAVCCTSLSDARQSNPSSLHGYKIRLCDKELNDNTYKCPCPHLTRLLYHLVAEVQQDVKASNILSSFFCVNQSVRRCSFDNVLLEAKVVLYS